MKFLMMTTLVAAALSLQAAHANPLQAKPEGKPVVINGKVLYKQAEPAAKPAVQQRSARSLATQPTTLYRGDVLESPQEFLTSTVSGDILVQPFNAADEAAIAKDYGVTVRYRTRGVILYEAPASAELQSLLSRLKSDKRVRHAQIELVSNEAQPQ